MTDSSTHLNVGEASGRKISDLDIFKRLRKSSKRSNDRNRIELASFKSPAGVFLSCLGCVVGTGNTWRFPRIIASASPRQGSLTFILAWITSLIFWSMPLSIVEYTIGRYCRTSPMAAFYQFLGIKLIWVGAWIVAVTYMITAYFPVIVGWCLYYLFISCTLPTLPSDEESSIALFYQFARDSYWPLAMHTTAIAIVGACIVGGIKWIEKANLVLVPMLLAILAFTFAWSLTRPYAEVGISFIFTPQWSSLLDPSIWVEAASQNAFDTGAAMALFITYSSYFTRSNGAVRFGTCVPIMNNLISLVCATTIFSTVFSTLTLNSPTLTRAGILRIMQKNGPGSTGLTFTWIPVLFYYVGPIGRVLCALFFLCLSFAGVTSLIAHIQLTVHSVKDLGVPKRIAPWLGLFLTWSFGLPSALSLDVLTNQDSVWGVALMFSGLAMAFVIIYYGPMKYRRVIVNEYGIGDLHLSILWVGMISVLVPISGVGLIVWWAYHSIISTEHWYYLTLSSITTTLLEWAIMLTILLLANGAIIWLKVNPFDASVSRAKAGGGYNPHDPCYPSLTSLVQNDVIAVSSFSMSRSSSAALVASNSAIFKPALKELTEIV